MSSTPRYAPLNHIKAPDYGQCVVRLSGTAGDAGNKLAFLTLAQVSLPPFTPPPPCPSSGHFKGQLDDNTPLLSPAVGIYSDEKGI